MLNKPLKVDIKPPEPFIIIVSIYNTETCLQLVWNLVQRVLHFASDLLEAHRATTME